MEHKRKKAIFFIATFLIPAAGMVLYILRLDDAIGLLLMLALILGLELNFLNKFLKHPVDWVDPDLDEYDGWVEVEVDKGGFRTASLVVAGDPETALETKETLTFKVIRHGEAS
jgi:hypothetical protein